MNHTTNVSLKSERKPYERPGDMLQSGGKNSEDVSDFKGVQRSEKILKGDSFERDELGVVDKSCFSRKWGFYFFWSKGLCAIFILI